MNGLYSGKDVKSLVPSLGRIEGKSKFGQVALKGIERLTFNSWSPVEIRIINRVVAIAC